MKSLKKRIGDLRMIMVVMSVLCVGGALALFTGGYLAGQKHIYVHRLPPKATPLKSLSNYWSSLGKPTHNGQSVIGTKTMNCAQWIRNSGQEVIARCVPQGYSPTQ